MQPGVKVNGAYYCDVKLLIQLLQTSVKLLATFVFQCPTRAQEHQAAATQDSGLHTRRASRPELSSVDYTIRTVIQECVYQTLSMSCAY